MLGRILDFAAAGTATGWVCAGLLTLASAIFLVAAAVLTRIDIAEHRLPDKIVLPLYAAVGLPIWTVLFLHHDLAGMRQTAYACVFLGGCYWVLRWASRGALGMGDVKLAGVIGLICGYLSPMNILWATLIAFVTGGVVSLALIMFRRARASTHIAFGPFMLLGAVIALIFPV
ncbi:A24 family peptidase [Rothia sp. LK2588]|uniref:prepilin peptidase n=1 Tax=Rothia sp. LK2588 TaxID=3114369 RepID=UPI0034CD175F